MVTSLIPSGHMAWLTVKQFQVQREDRVRWERWREVGKDREMVMDWLDDLRECLGSDRMSLADVFDQMRAVIHPPKEEDMKW